MHRIAIVVLALIPLGILGAAVAPDVSASTTCWYPGMPTTWTTDVGEGTVTYTLDNDQSGQPTVKVQGPDGTTSNRTIAPCGPGTIAYPGPVVSVMLPPLPVYAPPLAAPYFPHHHHW